VGVIQLIGILFRALLANRAALAMENLALRHQLAVLERSVKRPALRQRDRLFWFWLSRLWNGCRNTRHLVLCYPWNDGCHGLLAARAARRARVASNPWHPSNDEEQSTRLWRWLNVGRRPSRFP